MSHRNRRRLLALALFIAVALLCGALQAYAQISYEGTASADTLSEHPSLVRFVSGADTLDLHRGLSGDVEFLRWARPDAVIYMPLDSLGSDPRHGLIEISRQAMLEAQRMGIHYFDLLWAYWAVVGLYRE